MNLIIIHLWLKKRKRYKPGNKSGPIRYISIYTCYYSKLPPVIFCDFPLRAASPPFRKPVRSRFLGSLHRRAKRPEGSEFVRFAMELDQWISKVKEGQHLEEHELQLLCEYVR